MLSTGWRERLLSAATVPMVYQTEASDCGLACLAMVSAHLQGTMSLRDLRHMAQPSSRGMSLGDIVRVARDIGLMARPVKADLRLLRQIRTPAVLHWEFNHFVVLLSADARGIWINDPAIGRRRIAREDAERAYTGIALELSETDQFTRGRRAPQVSVTATMGRLVGFKRSLFTVLAIAAGVELSVVLLPFFLQWTLDYAVVGRDTELLAIIAGGFLGVVAINAGLTWFRSSAVTALGADMNLQWVSNTFVHLMRLPLDFFERRTQGGISSRFDSITVIQRAVSAGLAEALVDGLFVTGTLVVMLLYSARLALLSMAAVIVYGLFRLASHRKLAVASHEAVLATAKQRTTFLETLRGMQTLRLFGKEAERSVVWCNQLVDQFNAELRLQRGTNAARALNAFLFNSERILVVWVAAHAVIAGLLTPGMLFAYLAWREQFASRSFNLVDKAVEWSLLRVHAERLADIVDTAPEAAAPSAVDTRLLDPSIEVRQLGFAYGRNETPVLSSLSFNVAAGECVAITGPSGCGKTTLGKVILGLLEPHSGGVWIGGVDVARLSAPERRAMFGTVMQDDMFFGGSILENISFFDPQPDLERVHECVRLCGMESEVAQLPMRYQTLVGDLGHALSGGQRQRLLLARALYKQPRILLLDEATSQLDTGNERRIGEAIAKLRMTRIVIAHRPETIAMCDRVIDLGGSGQQGVRSEEEVKVLHGQRADIS